MAVVSIFRSGKGKWINFHQQGETSIQRSWNSSAGCQKSSELYLTLYFVESILGLGQQIETKLEGVDSNFWWVKTAKLSLKKYFSLFRWTACTNIHQFYFLIKDNPSNSPTLARELAHEFAAQFLFVSWVFRFLFLFLCFSWMGPKDSCQLCLSVYVLTYRYSFFTTIRSRESCTWRDEICTLDNAFFRVSGDWNIMAKSFDYESIIALNPRHDTNL